MPRADRRGQGGDGNSSSTLYTLDTTTTRHGENMASEQGPAALQSVTQGMEEGVRGREEVSIQIHSDGTNGVRPEHGVLA